MTEVSCVVRLGGSLLRLPDLSWRISCVLTALHPVGSLWITGGGSAVEMIRSLDQAWQMPAEKVHRDAIAVMSENAAMLARIDGRFQTVRNLSEAVSVRRRMQVPVLNVSAFLSDSDSDSDSDDDPGSESPVFPKSLPASWDVTSDSIAAWTAHRFCLNHLLLLKSCDCADTRVVALSRGGLVDRHFPEVASGLKIQWANLQKLPLEFVDLQKSV